MGRKSIKNKAPVEGMKTRFGCITVSLLIILAAIIKLKDGTSLRYGGECHYEYNSSLYGGQGIKYIWVIGFTHKPSPKFNPDIVASCEDNVL